MIAEFLFFKGFRFFFTNSLTKESGGSNFYLFIYSSRTVYESGHVTSLSP